ncbi:MAG: hypothetical protein L0H59_03575 [Tomitella sp.]|nr:hypothetical protein [Tomitella sp.]
MEPQHIGGVPTVVHNPYPIPPAALQRAYNTSGAALTTTAAASGVCAAGGLITSITSHGHLLFVALTVLAVGVCAATVTARHHIARRRPDAAAQVDAHRQQFGPDSIRLTSILDRPLAKLAADAHAATRTIGASAAVRGGALGDPEAVMSKAQILEWEVLTAAYELDRAVVERDLVRARIQSADGGTAALQQDDEQLLAALSRARESIAEKAESLVSLAGQVTDLDARRAAPAAQEALRRITPPPEPHDALPAGTDLAARIAAANEVLDAGGYTPHSLP